MQEVSMKKIVVNGIAIGLLVALLLLSLPCAGSNTYFPFINTNTQVSGQAVVNETTSIRWTTFSDGIAEKKEWTSISIREGPLHENWNSRFGFLFEEREKQLSWIYDRTSSYGTVSLKEILAQYR